MCRKIAVVGIATLVGSVIGFWQRANISVVLNAGTILYVPLKGNCIIKIQVCSLIILV